MAKWKESTLRRRAEAKRKYEQYRRDLAESLEHVFEHARKTPPDPYADDGGDDYLKTGE